MGHRYEFQAKWLNETDKSGFKISTWCKKEDIYRVKCLICNKSFSHASKGFRDIIQHSTSTSHCKNVSTKLVDKQLKIQINAPTDSSNPQRQVEIVARKDLSTKAEIFWAIKNVHSNMSAASCDGLPSLFQAMFSDSEAAVNFSLSAKKLSYLITDALGPHFQNVLIEDVNNSKGITVSFDETTNTANKKELQIRVRYFSETGHEVVDKHLRTIFLTTATGQILADSITQTIEDTHVSMRKLIMIGSDGPNVNKTVWNLLNSKLVESRGKGLLNIGTCNVYITHNAFLKGLELYGTDTSDFVIDIYHFFHQWPARWGNFESIQKKLKLPLHRFIEHSTTRWLTLKVCIERVLEQWRALTEYFLHYIPGNSASKLLLTTPRYVSICKYLRQLDMLAQMHFVANSVTLFEQFSFLFQKKEPLIHVLYDKIEHLLLTLAGRICTPDSVKLFKYNYLKVEELFNKENLIDVQSISLDDNVKEHMKKFTQLEKMRFLTNVREYYKAAGLHILKKSSLKSYPHSDLLYACRCLQVQRIRSKNSCRDIVKIAEFLPLEDVPSTSPSDEWKLLQMDNLPDFKNDERIDHYWYANVFQARHSNGDLKYPLISRVVKICLAISHGNSDVKRGFSKTKLILTEDKTAMKERTLNARLTVYEVTKPYKGNLHLIPIPNDLILKARFAHQAYIAYLDAEKRKQQEETEAEESKRKRLEEEKENLMKIESIDRNLKKLEQDLKNAQRDKDLKKQSSDILMLKASAELKEALIKKDFQAIHVAQAMMDAAESKREEERMQDDDVKKLSKEIEEKRKRLLTNLLKKRQSRLNENSESASALHHKTNPGIPNPIVLITEHSRKRKGDPLKESVPRKQSLTNRKEKENATQYKTNPEKQNTSNKQATKTKKKIEPLKQGAFKKLAKSVKDKSSENKNQAMKLFLTRKIDTSTNSVQNSIREVPIIYKYHNFEMKEMKKKFL